MDRRSLIALAAVAPGAALAAAAPARAGGKAETAAQPAYLRLPVITGGVTRPDGRRGVMTVEVGIDAPAELAQRAEQSLPRFRSALGQVVRRAAAEARPGMPPDVARLSRDLQAETDRVMGRPGVHALLGTVMLA